MLRFRLEFPGRDYLSQYPSNTFAGTRMPKLSKPEYNPNLNRIKGITEWVSLKYFYGICSKLNPRLLRKPWLQTSPLSFPHFFWRKSKIFRRGTTRRVLFYQPIQSRTSRGMSLRKLRAIKNRGPFRDLGYISKILYSAYSVLSLPDAFVESACTLSLSSRQR